MNWKKLIYGILIALIVASFVIIALYALDFSRPWMQENFTPPMLAIFGVPYNFIASSAPVQFIASNPLLIVLVGMIIGICPISFPVLHRGYNAFTGFWAARKMSESSIRLPVDTGIRTQTIQSQTPVGATTRPASTTQPTSPPISEQNETPKEETPT